MQYTERIDGFQIRDPTYFPGFEPKAMLPNFDIVKWEQHDPYEVIDMKTGKKQMSTENCYSVATLVWDTHEPGFDFRSVGMRWLESNPTPAVLQMIQDFVESKTQELDPCNDDIIRLQSWQSYGDQYLCPFCQKKVESPSKFCPSCGRRVFSRG